MARKHHEQRQLGIANGIASLPGFHQALHDLLVVEQFSLTDIALMFGVSRERIRQLAVVLGIQYPQTKGLTIYARSWDDEVNRFVWTRRKTKTLAHREHVEQDKIARNQALIIRRKKLIEDIKALKELLGRDPSLGEVAEMIKNHPVPGYAVGSIIASAWGRVQEIQTGQRSYKETFDVIRNLAGINIRPIGAPGHTHKLNSED